MFNIFATKSPTIGANISTRDRELDYSVKEIKIASGMILPKTEEEWRKYPIRNQLSTSSCVAHSVAKSLGVNNYIEEGKYLDLSPRFIYANRSNKPGLGMIAENSAKIVNTLGCPLEVQVPFINSEDEMNHIDDVTEYDKQTALIAKSKGVIHFNVRDIDTIANYIESTGRCVNVFVQFHYNEWTDVPVLKSGLPMNCRHCIPLTNGILYNKDIATTAEDSWGPAYGRGGRRILTREWFESGRVYEAYAFEDVQNNWRDVDLSSVIKPKYKFNNVMKLGERSDDVLNLQKCLKSVGFFPETQEPTGYYGGITANAVLQFALKHLPEHKQEVLLVNGKSVGRKTLSKLNEIFN